MYYQSDPIGDAALKVMRRIDELYQERPFAGAPMLRDRLRAEGFAVGREHMTMLMRRMGIAALYRKPNANNRAPGHTIWPPCRARWRSRATTSGRWTSVTSRWRVSSSTWRP